MSTSALAAAPRRNLGRTFLTFGALAAFGWVLSSYVATAARADTTDEILDMLKRKGEITQAEYTRLKARHEAEKAQAVPAGYAAGSLKDGGPSPEFVTVLPKGVGVRIGSVDVKIGGDISFFAIEQFPGRNNDDAFEIEGGLATSGQKNNSNSIRAGLLPSSINVGLSTTQNGYDIGAFFGVYIGGNNISPDCGLNANCEGAPFALGTAGVDWRQVYGTVGTADRGTIKFGRDIGIFGQDAILNDATIFGSGTPANNFAPANTTLGRIGLGYVYADFMPQITYTSPEWRGFTFTAGVFTPLNTISAGGAESADISGQDSPMLQGRIKWHHDFGGDCGQKDVDCRGPIKVTAWNSYVFQEHQVEFGDEVDRNVGDSVESWGVDGGIKVDWSGFSVVGYLYTGTGLGTTGLFFNGFDIFGNARDSSGGYIQASYTFFNKLTVGGSFGESDLDMTSSESGFNTELVKSNQATIGYVKYQLSDWVALQGEFIHTESENHQNQTNKDDAVAIGATIFW
jgi:predicted porin